MNNFEIRCDYCHEKACWYFLSIYLLPGNAFCFCEKCFREEPTYENIRRAVMRGIWKTISFEQAVAAIVGQITAA